MLRQQTIEQLPLNHEETGLRDPYQFLFEMNPQPMWVYDVESLIVLAVNQAAVEQYGYPREEFLRMTLKDITPEADLPALLDRVGRPAVGLYRSGEWKHLKKDGTFIDVEVVTHDLDWGGTPARLVLAADITQQKRSEERLRQTEDSCRKLVELSPDAMLVHRQGTIIFANAACGSLFRASGADELLGKQLLDLVHPDDRDIIRERMQGISLSQPPLRVERRYKSLDGQDLEVELMVSHLLYEGRLATQLIFRDISARKKNERMLRKSEGNLATAQRIAHLGSWEQDILSLGQFDPQVRWSDEVFRMFGLESGQAVVSREVFLNALHPDDKERVQATLLTAVREKTSICHNYRIIRPDGSERVLHSEAEFVCDEKTQRPMKIVGIIQDITDQKRVEEELLHLAAIVKSSNDAILSLTPDGVITTWNAGAERMFGYSSKEAIGQLASFLASKDVRPEQIAILAELRKGRSVANLETTRIRKDGSVIQVSVTVSPIRDYKGEIVAGSAIARDITERKKSEERFQKAFTATPEPMTIATIAEGRYVDVNPSFLRVSGYQRDEVIGRTSLGVNFWDKPEDRARFIEILERDGEVRDFEISFRTKSGQRRTAVGSADVIEIDGEKCAIAIFKDVTEQRLLEQQLRQSQKMEAIGRLSGGVAHDFNNLLGVIIGYSEMLEEQLDASARLKKNAGEIKKAAQRAASLTRQLLAFSRQQVLEPKVLNLNAIVTDTEKLLRRLIGEDIRLNVSLSQDLGRVKADQGQIEQVIMNLAVNARDAMPDGGDLILETGNADLDEGYAIHHPPVTPGKYVVLTVTDTGAGMSAETQARIFEPFFTTKEQGKGTGLGLATVYGVVKQSGGYIWVYSELGVGSTFKVYLPRVDAVTNPESASGDVTRANNHGSETILLVEDEESLRNLTRVLLEQSGYTVLEAANAEEATQFAEEHFGPIHVLLTDMVMPGMSGLKVADRVRAIRKDAKVIFMSGYAGFNQRETVCSEGTFLSKPFTKHALLEKLHEALSAKM